MLSIKISYNNEIRPVSVYSDNESFTYDNLVETTRTLFPILRSCESLNLAWSDDEDDICDCSSDAEVAEALRVMNGKTLKFSVSLKDDPDKASTAGDVNGINVNTNVYSDITCNGCGMSSLVGTRYKCTVREGFDMCEACESSQKQPYPMIKIYSPDQAPAAVMIATPPFPPHGPHMHRGPHPRFSGGTAAQRQHARRGRGFHHCGPPAPGSMPPFHPADVPGCNKPWECGPHGGRMGGRGCPRRFRNSGGPGGFMEGIWRRPGFEEDMRNDHAQATFATAVDAYGESLLNGQNGSSNNEPKSSVATTTTTTAASGLPQATASFAPIPNTYASVEYEEKVEGDDDDDDG